MATIKRFEDLEVWQLARELNIKITPIFNKLNEAKSYELKNQLDRSSGSDMDNIAEGFERDGNRELIQFLAIAKGSLGEVRSQLYRIFDRNFLEKQNHDLLQEDCLQLGSKLGKFISYLNNSSIKGNKFKNQTKT